MRNMQRCLVRHPSQRPQVRPRHGRDYGCLLHLVCWRPRHSLHLANKTLSRPRRHISYDILMDILTGHVEFSEAIFRFMISKTRRLVFAWCVIYSSFCFFQNLHLIYSHRWGILLDSPFLYCGFDRNLHTSNTDITLHPAKLFPWICNMKEINQCIVERAIARQMQSLDNPVSPQSLCRCTQLRQEADRMIPEAFCLTSSPG